MRPVVRFTLTICCIRHSLTALYKELGDGGFARDQSTHHRSVLLSVEHVYCSLALHIHIHHHHHHHHHHLQHHYHCPQKQQQQPASVYPHCFTCTNDQYTTVTTSDVNKNRYQIIYRGKIRPRWLRGTMVERQSVTGELSLSYARPAADG